MRGFGQIMLLLSVVCPCWLLAQNPVISRFVPGPYNSNQSHRVELFNPQNRPIPLAGYRLITRDYAFEFPNGITLQGESVYSIGKLGGRNLPKPDLVLNQVKDLHLRGVYDQDGNYVVLIDKNGELVDGMYFSPNSQVAFLPDKVAWQSGGRNISLLVPPESAGVWKGKSVNTGPDPVLCFIHLLGPDTWLPTSISANLTPATQYKRFSARYFKGVVTLRWTTTFEDQAFFHRIERSPDGIDFEMIRKIRAKDLGPAPQDYEFFDDSLEMGESYYYRITNFDLYGFQISTEIQEVKVGGAGGDFFMEVFLGKTGAGQEVNILFSAKRAMRARIKVLDERFREVGLIFDDDIPAEKENLIKLSDSLPPGKYLIVADILSQRFFKEIIID